jgi:hypothetical protein
MGSEEGDTAVRDGCALVVKCESIEGETTVLRLESSSWTREEICGARDVNGVAGDATFGLE